MAVLAFFLAAAFVIKEDGTELRENCGPSEPVVARLQAGTAVTVKFGLNGCLAVQARLETGIVTGYVTSDQLRGAEEWEKARRSARAVGGSGVAERSVNTRSETGAGLLLANRYREALEWAERNLVSSSKDPELLAIAGIAAYRTGAPSRAAGYLRDAVALRPDPNLEELLGRAEREAASEKGIRDLHSPRFWLRYDASALPEDGARRLLQVLDEEYARISFELGCRGEERIAAILQTPEDYRRASGLAEWSGGLFDGRIRVALMGGDPGGALLRRILAHEIVHACLASTGDWPAWLHEGLAQRLSGETLTAPARERIREARRTKMLPRLDDLSRDWSSLSTDHATMAYGAALLAVDLFYEHHREFGIRNLLRSPEQLARITSDLQQRMGQ